MLNDALLEKRINEFLGYGNLESDYWAIGMEEGGGITLEEINQRLNRWEELNHAQILDNYDFHRKIESDFKVNGRSQTKKLSCFFDTPIRIQRTWAALIRTILNKEGSAPVTTDMVKNYQSQSWGRLDSNNCLLEIFPLPSPGINSWSYGKWSKLPSLTTRKKYIESYKENRINLIKSKLSIHSPKVVFFYSLNKKYIQFWENISGVSFSDKNKILIYKKYYAHLEKRNGITFVLTGQPSYIRAHKYWDQLGRYLKDV